VPATRFASRARRPVGAKLGFSFSGGAPPYLVGGRFELSSPRKDTSWDGSGFLERLCLVWEEADGDLESRRRCLDLFGVGERDEWR